MRVNNNLFEHISNANKRFLGYVNIKKRKRAYIANSFDNDISVYIAVKLKSKLCSKTNKHTTN